jgi:hypothetical protein
MKTRCKVGDLAYVVGSSRPEQNGMIVEVVREGQNGHPWWMVKFRGFVVTMRGNIVFGAAQVLDEYLRPLDGLPVDEDTREELTA